MPNSSISDFEPDSPGDDESSFDADDCSLESLNSDSFTCTDPADSWAALKSNFRKLW